MTWFIFAGDMLVMFFMVALIIWVFMVSSDKDIDSAANIPLQDEDYESELLTRPEDKNTRHTHQEGAQHG